MVEKLLKENKVFYCYVSVEFLEREKEKVKNEKCFFRYLDEWVILEKDKYYVFVVCLKVLNYVVFFNDVIKKEVKFEFDELDFFVFLR